MTEATNTTHAELIAERDQLQTLADSRQEHVERLRDMVTTERDQSRTTIRLLLAKASRHEELLKQGLHAMYGSADKFSADHDSLVPTWHKVFRLAQLLGHTSELVRFADHMGLTELYQRWHERDGGVTVPAGVHTHQVADQVALEHETLHPLDPRLSDVWEQAFEASNQLGFCSTFEDIAEKLGIPEQERAWEGTVDVAVYVSVPVSGHSTRREAEEYGADIDESDIVEAIRNGGAHWEVTDQELDFS